MTVDAASPTETSGPPLELRFAGWLVQQLGSELYPSVTAAVAELISNAWDADATRVWVRVPFDTWKQSGQTIEVIDNGTGMTRKEAQDKYLVVGRRRRDREKRDTTLGGRKLHGRKGIGKLAAFGTASILDCITVKDGRFTAFRLDYAHMRTREPDEPYTVEEPEDKRLPSDENGDALTQGTRIVLRGLNSRRAPSRSRFMDSMARRFAIGATQMQVYINGERLEAFQAPDLEIKFPDRALPPDSVLVADDPGWAQAQVPDGHGVLQPVKWWVGFTSKPIREEDQQGISVLVHDKLAQRPFTFELGSGTTGQLGLEYLVGEVKADWIDDGWDEESDLIQSNRDGLQLQAEELKPFLHWGQALIRWSLKQRNDLRKATNATSLDPAVDAFLKTVSARERPRLRAVAVRLVEFGLDAQQLVDLLRQIVAARDDAASGDALDAALASHDPADPALWQAMADVEDHWRRTMRRTVAARVQLLGLLSELADAGEDLDDIGATLAANPWILGPSAAVAVLEDAGPPARLTVRTADAADIGVVAAGLNDAVSADDARRHLAELEARHDQQQMIAAGFDEPVDDDPRMTTWTTLLRQAANGHGRLLAILDGDDASRT